MPWTNFMTGIYMFLFCVTGVVVYKVYRKQNQEEEG